MDPKVKRERETPLEEASQTGMLSTCEGRGLLRPRNANASHVVQQTKPPWQHQTQSEGGNISDKTITHPCQHLRHPNPSLRRRFVLSPSERVPTGMISKPRRVVEYFRTARTAPYRNFFARSFLRLPPPVLVYTVHARLATPSNSYSDELRVGVDACATIMESRHPA